MEVYDELAATRNGLLITDMLLEAENGIFGVSIDHSWWTGDNRAPDTILNAVPEMKTIKLDSDGVSLVIA